MGKHILSQIRKKARNILKGNALILLMLLLAFIPRVYKLGWGFHSIDSDRWFRRSVSFQENLLNGDFKETYQKQHPGVTLMYLGGFGYKVLTSAFLRIEGRGINENVPEEFPLINFSLKFPLLLADLFLIFLSYFLAKKLFTKKAALLYLFILLLDPFFFFYTRQFHLDVLMALFSINSVLALGLYFQNTNKNRLYFHLSAILGALAFLTKSPAGIFVLGNAGALAIFHYMGRKKNLLDTLKETFKYGLIAFVTYIVVFPSNWVNLFENTYRIFENAYQNTKQGNAVHLYDAPFSNLGYKFYLLVFFFRFSAILVGATLLSAIIGAKKLIFKKREISMDQSKLPLLLGYLGYTGLLIANTKTYERYMVPLVPALTLLSAVYLSKYVKERIMKVTGIALLIAFAVVSILKHPNYIIYRTLFASPDKQMALFSELGACNSTLSQIGRFLNEKEAGNSDYDVAISGVYESCLKPFIEARTNNLVNMKTPKYYILFKTDRDVINSTRIKNSYKLIKTYYISKTPVYYIFEKAQQSTKE